MERAAADRDRALAAATPHLPGPLLAGRRAVVTGGAAGIGGAIVAAFVAHGADVLAVDRDEQALGRLVESLGEPASPPVDGAAAGERATAGAPAERALARERTVAGAPAERAAAGERAAVGAAAERAAAGERAAMCAPAERAAAGERAGSGFGRGSVEPLLLDVTEDGAAERIAAACEPDVLVNNVGHFLVPPQPFAGSDPAGWEAVEAVNLTHVLRCTRALLPGMIARGRGGAIVNLTTVEAFRGIPGHAVYAACKAAVTQFGRSLAVEVGRHGIRVNAIAPDVVESPQLPYSEWVPPEERWRWETWVPLARHGTGADVAGAALFLASPLSAFVTGTTVHVDGGTHAAGGWYPRADGAGWTNRPLAP